MEQLDDELPDDEAELSQSQSQTQEGLLKKQRTGQWRSVRGLEQFWEMMSFRQECSSGRLVGFLWATFQPTKLCGEYQPVDVEERHRNLAQSALPTPLDSQHLEASRLPPQSPLRSSPSPEIHSKTKNPPMPPCKPSPTPTPVEANRVRTPPEETKPKETKHYYWPKSSRGELVLLQKEYQRAGKLALASGLCRSKDRNRKYSEVDKRRR